MLRTLTRQDPTDWVSYLLSENICGATHPFLEPIFVKTFYVPSVLVGTRY